VAQGSEAVEAIMGWAEEASLGEFLQTGIELRGQIVVASSALAAARLFAFPRLCKLSIISGDGS
jgi:hypothetical protein